MSKKKSAKIKDKEPENKDKKQKKPLGIMAIRHSKVLDKLSKNVGKSGKINMTETLIESGYSKHYADNGNFKKTKAWASFVEQYLPDEKLAKVHGQLIEHQKIEYMLFTSEIKDEDIYDIMEMAGNVPKKIVHGIQGTHVWYFQADGTVRKNAIELAYKVKGKMAPDKIELEQTGFKAMSDAELAAFIKQKKARFTKKD